MGCEGVENVQAGQGWSRWTAGGSMCNSAMGAEFASMALCGAGRPPEESPDSVDAMLETPHQLSNGRLLLSNDKGGGALGTKAGAVGGAR